MHNYKTTFVRPTTAVDFPSMPDSALLAHITTAHTIPTKTVEVSLDTLILTMTRTFASEEAAVAFSQDPLVVAWAGAAEAHCAANGIEYAATFEAV
jgi:hypothetical protein